MATKGEKEMMQALKDHIGSLSNIKESSKYSVFDAYNELALVELKDRRGPQYEDTFIEKKKLKALAEVSAGRVCLYVVRSAGNIYCFNLNKLTKEDYDFRWETKWCNKTTDFYGKAGNQQKIEKVVGHLDWADAYITIMADGTVERNDGLD